MNANLTLSEIITIAFIMLLVFGPHRLPEMARKAGEWIGKLRSAASAVVQEFNAEYDEIAKPIKDLDSEIKAVRTELKGAVPDLSPITDDLDEALAGSQSPGGDQPEVSGNGAAAPFEAELAAAREEARAEITTDSFEAELAAARDEVRAELENEAAEPPAPQSVGTEPEDDPSRQS